MINLESDKMKALWPNDSLSFILWDILKKHTKVNNFCKRSFMIQ